MRLPSLSAFASLSVSHGSIKEKTWNIPTTEADCPTNPRYKSLRHCELSLEVPNCQNPADLNRRPASFISHPGNVESAPDASEGYGHGVDREGLERGKRNFHRAQLISAPNKMKLIVPWRRYLCLSADKNDAFIQSDSADLVLNILKDLTQQTPKNLHWMKRPIFVSLPPHAPLHGCPSLIP